jgi:hypothetical protein
MLGLVPKISTNADISGCLAQALGPQNARLHVKALSSLAGLRLRALTPSAEDASEGDRSALRAYRAQLTSLEARLTQADIDAAKLVFSWSDTLKPKVVDSHATIGYERASLLFNEAALLSRAAAKGVCERTPEGRKNGIKNFRDAAAALTYLKDVLMPR